MILKLTGKKALAKSESAKLVGLDHITPGDFSVIARKVRFTDKNMSVVALIDYLYEEQHLKGVKKARIGF